MTPESLTWSARRTGACLKLGTANCGEVGGRRGGLWVEALHLGYEPTCSRSAVVSISITGQPPATGRAIWSFQRPLEPSLSASCRWSGTARNTAPELGFLDLLSVCTT